MATLIMDGFTQGKKIKIIEWSSPEKGKDFCK
jgi:hypothetical protein